MKSYFLTFEKSILNVGQAKKKIKLVSGIPDEEKKVHPGGRNLIFFANLKYVLVNKISYKFLKYFSTLL